MKNRQINNLEELHRVKKEYAAKRKIAWNEFDQQLEVIKHDTTTYLLKKVVLPVGVGVLSSVLLKTFISSWTGRDKEVGILQGGIGKTLERSSPKNHWVKYLSIMFSMYKVYRSITHKSDGEVKQNANELASGLPNPKEFIRNFKSKSRQQTKSDPATTS